MVLFRAWFLSALVLSTVPSVLASPDSGWTWLGPEGGSLGPFLFSRDGSKPIFAASPNGVFSSQDAGVTWHRLANGLTDPNVVSLARSGSALLAGTLRQGLFRSDDEGQHWRRIDSELNDQPVLDLAVAPLDDRHVFAGTPESGVFRSEDGGATWTQSVEGLESLSVAGIAVSPLDSAVVFASVATGVFRSGDGGRTWTDITLNLPEASIFQNSLPTGQIVVNRQGEPLVVGAEGLFLLHDQTWSDLLQTSPFLELDPLTRIALHPTDPLEILASSGRGLIRSRDGGQTWERIQVANLIRVAARGLGYDSASPDRVFVGAAGSTFVSQDGGSSWRETRHGLRAAVLIGLGVDPTNPMTLHAGGLGGGLKSVSAGEWLPIRRELDGFDLRSIAQDAGNPNLLFAASDLTLFRSRDAGLHWEPNRSGPVSALACHPSIPDTVFAVQLFDPGNLFSLPRILRSRDGGDTWETTFQGLFGLISDVLPSRVDVNRIWFASSGGVYLSSQMGVGLTSVNSGLDDLDVTSLEELSTGAVLAGTSSGRLFRLDDPEGVWRELTRPSNTAINDLLANPDKTSEFYTATDGEGLFVSHDEGSTWAPVEGLESRYLYQALFSRDRHRIYVAGHGGVYEKVLEPDSGLGATIQQEVSGNAFPRGTITFSVRLNGPVGEPLTRYRFQEALPLGLKLIEATADSGEVYLGPAFNSVTWSGHLLDQVSLQIQAEALDGTTGVRLAAQGRLVREDALLGPYSVSDDPSTPTPNDATAITIGPSPFRADVLAVARALPIADTFVGFALLNPTPVPAQIEVRGLGPDGDTLESERLQEALQPSNQLARLVGEDLKSGQTALIESPEGRVQGFFLLGDYQLQRLDGLGGAQIDSQRLIFPRIQSDDQFETYLFLFNPDPGSSAEITLNARDTLGAPQATSQIVLPPNGSIWAPPSEIFQSPIPADGYVELRADRPVRGFELVASDRTFETLPAQPIEYADRLLAPHVFFGGGLGTTRLRLLNTSQGELRVTIRLLDDTAGLLGDPQVSVAVGELRVIDLAELFQDTGGPRQGWIEVRAATVGSLVPEWPALQVAVEYESGDGSTASTLPMQAHPLSRPTFLQVAQSHRSGIFQGLAMVGVGAAPFSSGFFNFGEIAAYDSTGFLRGIGGRLPGPNLRFSKLLDDPTLFRPGFEQEGGYLRLQSDQAVVVYTIFGGPGFLAAVDAQGESLLLY